MAEDAYISFRYASNLVEGQGLVFNPGERVEGYTNFLWTLLLAAGLKTGGSPHSLSVLFGLFFSGLALLAVFLLQRQAFPESIFPAALLALGLNYSWASFSTSGLETSLCAFLLTASFAVLWHEERSRPLWGGVLLALAVMTRPDAALAFAVALATLMVRRRPAREWLSLGLSFAAIYAPYFLWRAWYYADWLPNTFYAKSAGLTYYKQGLAYTAEFLGRYNLWLLLWLPPIAFLLQWKRELKAPSFVAPCAAFVVLYSCYVIRIGGDFMEGRFFIPVLPFLYLLLEWSIRNFKLRRVWTTVGLALLILSSAADRNRLPEHTIVNGITDERTWQPVVEAWLHEGEVMGRSLPPGTMVATDAVGAFGWTSRLPILDTLGLTDRTVAHLPITQRARPGHEKAAPVQYLQLRHIAILRDGVGIYRKNFGQPQFIFAGSRYYLLSNDPAIAEGFAQAIKELSQSLPSK